MLNARIISHTPPRVPGATNSAGAETWLLHTPQGFTVCLCDDDEECICLPPAEYILVSAATPAGLTFVDPREYIIYRSDAAGARGPQMGFVEDSLTGALAAGKHLLEGGA